MEQPNTLSILLNEREDMRRTVLELDKGLFKTMFAFLTVVLAIGAIHGEIIIDSNKEIPSYIFFFLSQILLFLGFFAVTQFSLKTKTVGYIRALEDKINELAGDKKVVIFHSMATPEFRLAGPHLWSIICLIVMVAVFLYILSQKTFGETIYQWIVVVECFLLVGLTIWSLCELKRTYNHTLELLHDE